MNNIIDYLIENEIFFINVLDKFNNDYTKLPSDLDFFTYYNEQKIDSTLAYSSSGCFYPLIKENYLNDTVKFLNENFFKIFSIYGHKNIVEKIITDMNKPYRYQNKYFLMKLLKEDFKPFKFDSEDFNCFKCGSSNFDELKELQYLYHKEEVYTKNSYYPYNAEMNALKETLKNKPVYAVYKKSGKKNEAVAKANVNGESPNFFQLGGIFTKNNFRNKGLSKFCLTKMIGEIFSSYSKSGIVLYVKQENIPAIKLYEKLGFKKEYETALCYY